MTLTEQHGTIRLDLTPEEAIDLAEFLRQFFAGDESIVDQVSAALDTVIETY